MSDPIEQAPEAVSNDHANWTAGGFPLMKRE